MKKILTVIMMVIMVGITYGSETRIDGDNPNGFKKITIEEALKDKEIKYAEEKDGVKRLVGKNFSFNVIHLDKPLGKYGVKIYGEEWTRRGWVAQITEDNRVVFIRSKEADTKGFYYIEENGEKMYFAFVTGGITRKMSSKLFWLMKDELDSYYGRSVLERFRSVDTRD